MSSSLSELARSLRDELATNQVVAPHALASICSPSAITAALDLPINTEHNLGRCLKLLAILILLEQSREVMRQCLEQRPSDEDLFNVFEFKPGCTEQGLASVFPENASLRKQVFEAQWIIAPILSRDHHQHFPANYKAPFYLVDIGRSLQPGSFGTLFVVRIAKGILQEERSAKESDVVVCKEVHSPIEESGGLEAMLMRRCRHDAVIELLASFDAPIGAVSANPVHTLHLILPYASGGDLQQFLDQQSMPSCFTNHRDARSFLLSQIHSLFSGLAFLHRPQKTSNEIILHFDLKPRNILLFRSGERYVMKIADFGNAQSMKSKDFHGPPLEHTTAEYAPPEAFNTMGGLIPGESHGPQFDVYSMGCIALQMMIIAGNGWRGLVQEFREHRTTAGNPQALFSREPDVVRDWVARLQADELQRDDRFASMIIELVRQCVDGKKSARPCAWEVDAHLEQSRPKNEADALEDQGMRISNRIPEPANCFGRQSPSPWERAKFLSRSDPPILANLIKHAGWDVFCPRDESRALSINRRFCNNLPASHKRTQYGLRRTIDKIRDAFLRPGCTCVGIWGLGGSGKSRSAYEYSKIVYNVRPSQADGPFRGPAHVFWIDAGNAYKAARSCTVICGKVGIAIPDSCGEPYHMVKSWLENECSDKWLMVIDGLDSETEARRWWEWGLPTPATRGAGRVIITTKNRELLQDFTLFDDAATFPVNTLDEQDALRLFTQELGAAFTPAIIAQDEFNTLWNILGIPLFLILAAQYLKKYRVGHTTIPKLASRLQAAVPNFTCLDKRPDSAEKVQQVEMMQFKIFRVLLEPFVDHYTPDTNEFRLQSVLCCMAPEDLDIQIFSFACEDSHPIEEWLGTLGNYSYITEQDQNGKYAMHDLLHRFFLRYIYEHPQLGPNYLLKQFGGVIKQIFCLYRASSTKISGSQHGYYRKQRFMPHFEQLVDFVKMLQSSEPNINLVPGGCFENDEAWSIISFSRVLHIDNQTDDALMVLDFAISRGVVPNQDKPKEAHSTMVELHRHMAYYQLDRLSGREKEFYLRQARIHFEAALEVAIQHDLYEYIAKTGIDLIEVLSRLGLLEEAEAQIRHLRDELDGNSPFVEKDEDRTRLSMRLDNQVALVEFEKAKRDQVNTLFASAAKHLLSARRMSIHVIDQAHRNTKENVREEIVFEKLRMLAQIDMEMPHFFPLREAEAIYAANLQRRERQLTASAPALGDGPEKTMQRATVVHLARARANLAAVWLRMGQLCSKLGGSDIRGGAQGHWRRARDVLESVLHDLRVVSSTADGLTRSVAYNLREVLFELGLQDDGQALATEFNLLPPECLDGAAWFQPEGSDGAADVVWPTAWTTPLGIDEPSEEVSQGSLTGPRLSLRSFDTESQLLWQCGSGTLVEGAVELFSQQGQLLWCGCMEASSACSPRL